MEGIVYVHSFRFASPNRELSNRNPGAANRHWKGNFIEKQALSKATAESKAQEYWK